MSFQNFLHSYSRCKTSTWDQETPRILRGLRAETPTANYLSLLWEPNAAHIRYVKVEVWRRKRW